jgi:RNase P subunit RPR2
MAFAWKKMKKEPESKRLRCTECNNPELYVIVEPVRRQARSMTAHHKRIVARCPKCEAERRIKLGGPD